MLNSCKFMKYVKNSRIGDNISKIDRMIERGICLNYMDYSMKCTPLITSIIYVNQTSNMEAIMKLIDGGADVNFANINNDSALIFACYFQNIDIVKLLIRAGANINHQNNYGYTPLMIAQNCLNYNEFTHDNINNILEIMNLLIDSGVDINLMNKKNNNSILIAVKNSKYYGIEQIKLLIEKGKININSSFRSNKNLLSYACYYFSISSSYQAIEYLINLGIDINVQDKKGYTPLMYLIAKSNNITTELIDCIKLLLNAKPNLDLKSNNSHNALSIACINAIKTKDSSIIKLLIRAGADVNILSNFNANCISFLSYKGPYLAIQLFDLLIDNKIDLNVQSMNTLNGTYDGYTSLHYAARGIVEKTSIPEIIDLLLKNGADPDIRNNMNETYLDIIDKPNKNTDIKQKYISMKCLVCFEENNNTMYMFDCGHCVSCESCSNMIIETTNKCPYCRSTFTEFETIKMID